MILMEDDSVRTLARPLEVQRAGFMIRYYELKRAVKGDEGAEKSL
jgi:hypothetical protein